VGKAVANGMPLSAYVGRADLLDAAPDIGISSTFGGEALSLAAAKAVLGFYRDRGVIAYLWEAGGRLWPRVQELLDARGVACRIEGVSVCPSISFADPRARETFFRACYRNGVSLYDVPYVTWSHRPSDVDEALERFARAVREL
jgi:glutamate-1-semialdehyde 2,1-aminomutase